VQANLQNACSRLHEGDGNPAVPLAAVARLLELSPAPYASAERQVLSSSLQPPEDTPAHARRNSGVVLEGWTAQHALDHVGNIFIKPNLLPANQDHRRVLAVLAFLRKMTTATPTTGRVIEYKRSEGSGKLCEVATSTRGSTDEGPFTAWDRSLRLWRSSTDPARAARFLPAE